MSYERGALLNSDSRQRGVMTLAYGPQRFVEQARSLAHSLQLHAPHLPRTLVTDSNDPTILRLFTEVIGYRPEYGSGVRQKIFLDQYSPYDETLFIDSDCLVLGNLESFWTAFAGQSFGVPGFRYLEKGSADPYLDVDHVLETFGVTRLPKFNGGTYYFVRSSQATDFFDTARNLLDNWCSLRLREFRRNGPNDEAIYSIAMAVHHIAPTAMVPGGMWTPVGYKGPLLLDALTGNCSFEKEGMMLAPEVIHFPGEYAFSLAYARERARLQAKIEGKRMPLSTQAASLIKSVLWQTSRRFSALSKFARVSVRSYRRATSSSSAGSQPGLAGAAGKSGLQK
jgi:hypothetical protein